VNIVSSQNHF